MANPIDEKSLKVTPEPDTAKETNPCDEATGESHEGYDDKLKTVIDMEKK